MEIVLNEYLLVISPEDDISKEITKIKYEFRDHYGCIQAARLKPHCTLMNFVQHQRVENHLIREFDSIVASFTPKAITLDGFGQYPMHTIYIKIKESKKIKEMITALKLKFRSVKNEIKPLKPIYPSDPHLTIARGMTQVQFNQAWTEWGKRKFNSSFNAYNVRLLKRQIDEKDLKPKENYQIVKDFKLAGQEKKDKQLILF